MAPCLTEIKREERKRTKIETEKKRSSSSFRCRTKSPPSAPGIAQNCRKSGRRSNINQIRSAWKKNTNFHARSPLFSVHGKKILLNAKSHRFLFVFFCWEVSHGPPNELRRSGFSIRRLREGQSSSEATPNGLKLKMYFSQFMTGLTSCIYMIKKRS